MPPVINIVIIEYMLIMIRSLLLRFKAVQKSYNQEIVNGWLSLRPLAQQAVFFIDYLCWQAAQIYLASTYTWGLVIGVSENGWTNDKLGEPWLKEVFENILKCVQSAPTGFWSLVMAAMQLLLLTISVQRIILYLFLYLHIHHIFFSCLMFLVLGHWNISMASGFKLLCS